MLRLVPLLLALLPQAPAPEVPGELEWHEDLDALVEGLKRTHVAPFHTLEEERLDAMAEALHERILDLEPHAIVVELARIVAAIGDGHTELPLTPDEHNGFHQLPLRLYAFEEGLFVQAIAREHAGFAGARVLAIGGTAADEAYRRVAEVTPRDNEHQLRAMVPRLLGVPEVLHALGIAPALERVTFLLERGAEEAELVLTAGPPVPGLQDWSVEPRPALFAQGFVGARAGDAPPYLAELDQEKRIELLPGSRALYVRLTSIRDGPAESFADFAARALARAAAEGAERIVLDLRHNGGGNNQLNLPWLHGLLRSPFDRPGGLFVLIGRHTFSAASHLVTLLEIHTHAVFVGEPTGASPNHYGDASPIRLPHSRVIAYASSLYWQNSLPWERRTATIPDVPVAPRFADYRAGRDPALDACLAWKPH